MNYAMRFSALAFFNRQTIDRGSEGVPAQNPHR